MGWLNVAMFVVKAVTTVEGIIKDKGKTKQDKAVELIDEAIEGISITGLDKGVLLLPEVQDAKRKMIDATVAFENAVVAGKKKLNS